ncbi:MULTISPECIES: hypothetical protein [unclassified Adlercreutzia]|uniref:hypothetical protein n=1 Tax=unclassified Adlercreutzia TaxID=2636013 RepID=UPI0013E9E4FE|nr:MULTISPECIES: hypothetical protein [unclassified Adlercreutzia]
MSKKGVQQIIDSVRDAVEKECWIPALVTAMTIPDVLGQIEFPELAFKTGKRKVGEQYKAWFHEHVEHRYVDASGFDEEWHAKNPYFSAEMCWSLRNAILHQGSDDIEHEYRFEDENGVSYSYGFELRVNACDSYGAIWHTPQPEGKLHKCIHVCIDVATLCKVMCDEAQSYLDCTDDKAFENAGISILDVAKLGSQLGWYQQDSLGEMVNTVNEGWIDTNR